MRFTHHPGLTNAASLRPESHPARRRIRPAAMHMWLAAVLVPAALSACSVGHPAPATSEAATMAQMWNIFFWVGCAVAAFVYVLFAWSMIMHRRRRTPDATDTGASDANADDELPPQFEENTKLELVYTAIPLLIVLVLFVLTFTSLAKVDAKEQNPDVTVHVYGFDWSWQFDYESGPPGVRVVGTSQDPPTLRLPAGSRVRFLVNSRDVDHSFYVPAFLYKMDAIPGENNSFDVHLDNRTGNLAGHCAEYCGLDHAYMLFNVVVMPPADFAAWQADAARTAAAKQPAPQPPSSTPSGAAPTSTATSTSTTTTTQRTVTTTSTTTSTTKGP